MLNTLPPREFAEALHKIMKITSSREVYKMRPVPVTEDHAVEPKTDFEIKRSDGAPRRLGRHDGGR